MDCFLITFGEFWKSWMCGIIQAIWIIKFYPSECLLKCRFFNINRHEISIHVWNSVSLDMPFQSVHDHSKSLYERKLFGTVSSKDTRIYLNIKMSLYQYGDSHYTNKMVSWPTYFYNCNPNTRKGSFHYEIGSHILLIIMNNRNVMFTWKLEMYSVYYFILSLCTFLKR